MKINLSKIRQIIKEEITRITEGDVVDLFPKGKPAPQDKEVLAKALAKRAEVMLDLDGDGDDIEVRVEPSIFLSPYIDVDGHGKEVPSLADHVYDNYVLGMAGDHAEKLDDIVSRIDIDYFDEPIIDVMKSVGDDRFGDSSNLNLTFPAMGDDRKSQHSKTKDAAARQDQEDIGQMELDFDRYMQGIESGKVVELEAEDD